MSSEEGVVAPVETKCEDKIPKFVEMSDYVDTRTKVWINLSKVINVYFCDDRIVVGFDGYSMGLSSYSDKKSKEHMIKYLKQNTVPIESVQNLKDDFGFIKVITNNATTYTKLSYITNIRFCRDDSVDISLSDHIQIHRGQVIPGYGLILNKKTDTKIIDKLKLLMN